MTIVVTGGSGFVGTALCKRLLEEKHTVIVVAKKAPFFTHKQLFYIQCDLETQPLPYNILERTDAVVHLSGISKYQKWKKGIKERIRTSRVESTRRVVESIQQTTNRPSVFVCASSIHYYGDSSDERTEDSPKGEGFLADVTAAREQEAFKAEESGVRVVCIRTAPVLGKGGLFSFLGRISKLRLFWKLSKKDFLFSWIHIEDIVNAYVFALETKTVQGVINASAPKQTTGSVFMSLFAKHAKRLLIGTLPKRLRALLFGELYDELIKNNAVAPKRLLAKGFVFQYETIEEAMQHIEK